MLVNVSKGKVVFSVVFFVLFGFSALGYAKKKKPKKAKKALAKKPLKKTKNTLAGVVKINKDAYLWASSLKLLEIGIRTGHDLLLQETKRSLSSDLHQVRIKWNAASIQRITGAYTYYTKRMRLQFPAVKKDIAILEKKVKLLNDAAKQLEKAAVDGKLNKLTMNMALQKILATKLPVIGKHSKKLSEKKRKLLLASITGFATGNELLMFFRIRQVVRHLSGAKSTKEHKGQIALVFNHMKYQRGVFRTLKRWLGKSTKGLGLFLYHSALLARCALLQSKASESPSTKRKKLVLRYRKRMRQLKQSLVKTNPSFGSLWRSAVDE